MSNKMTKFTNHKDKGLTVGELTITLAIIIFFGIIFFTFHNNKDQDQSFSQNQNLHLSSLNKIHSL